jgi:hypothetical protein
MLDMIYITFKNFFKQKINAVAKKLANVSFAAKTGIHSFQGIRDPRFLRGAPDIIFYSAASLRGKDRKGGYLWERSDCWAIVLYAAHGRKAP